ncbi:MAG: HDOD domain-containing protein [Lentisphaerae bacterium]|nr:MAG: HDOD domain-containing protein [Lentisphaerota bacterium]
MNDPALSTRLLNIANSALFRPPGSEPLADLRQVVMRIGFKEIRNIAMASAVVRLVGNIPHRLFNRTEFLRHCIATSLIAIHLGQKLRHQYPALKSDELHLGGLLHDLGKIFLDAEFPEQLEECISLSMHHRLPLVEAERLVMELTHDELGEYLCRQWELPPVARHSIRYHHNPAGAPAEHRITIMLINMANYLANVSDLGNSGDFTRPVFDQTVWKQTGTAPNDFLACVEEARKQVDEIMQLFV